MQGLQRTRIFIIGTTAALLAGCASFPASQQANNTAMTWQTREQQLSQLTHWQATGAIAIQQDQHAQSASLIWRQNSFDNYTLQLQGPLGAGAMKITGQPGKVTLLTSNSQTFSAPTAESLLQAQTGWYLPLTSLYYWSKGLPVPGIAAKTDYDQYHHITQLQQQGWTINYLSYTGVNHLDLPSKLVLTKSPFRIKLIFSQWQIN